MALSPFYYLTGNIRLYSSIEFSVCNTPEKLAASHLETVKRLRMT